MSVECCAAWRATLRWALRMNRMHNRWGVLIFWYVRVFAALRVECTHFFISLLLLSIPLSFAIYFSFCGLEGGSRASVEGKEGRIVGKVGRVEKVTDSRSKLVEMGFVFQDITRRSRWAEKVFFPLRYQPTHLWSREIPRLSTIKTHDNNLE